jgi:hypothetical protein
MSANPIQQRRRRVLRDEPKEVRKSERPKSKSGRRYSDGALEESQLRITDFLPRATWRLGVVFAVGMTSIAALLLTYGWQAGKSMTAGQPIASALDLASPGSIAAWFAAAMAIGCAAAALIIFGIRRHRIADYRGRYRMWTWAAFVFLLASLDAVAQISQLAAGLVLKLTGGFFISTPATWVLLGWSILALTVAVPFLLELRMSQSTMAGLLAAGLCYATAGLLYGGYFQGSTTTSHAMLQVGFLHTAHLAMFTSLLAFARLVFLDAQGQLVRKERKRREITPPDWAIAWRRKQTANRAARRAARQERKAAGAAEPTSKSKPKVKTKRVAKKAAPAVVKVEYDDAYDEQEVNPEILQNPDLTKAERRKLKKQLKQQQRRAA